MSQHIVLHQWEISPFCRKTALTLDHKGLAFETLDYIGLQSTKVVGLSRAGKLPVLDIDGQRLQDSTRIARYLDEHYPEHPLYPVDPIENAQAAVWEDWADESLYWFEVYFRYIDNSAMEQVLDIVCAGRPKLERIAVKAALKIDFAIKLRMQGLGRMSYDDVVTEFTLHLDRIEAVLARQDWLVGLHRSIADIAVGAQLAEVVRTSQLRDVILARPNLAKWLKRI